MQMLDPPELIAHSLSLLSPLSLSLFLPHSLAPEPRRAEAVATSHSVPRRTRMSLAVEAVHHSSAALFMERFSLLARCLNQPPLPFPATARYSKWSSSLK